MVPPPSPNGDPEYGFWEVETPSLRDLPQQFRRLEIVRNGDNTISIFALDVDHAANSALLEDGSASPAWTSRSYAIATQQIFANQVAQGPHVDPSSGVYYAELVKHLSTEMQAKVAGILPVVSSLRISNDFLASYRRRIVTLNNTVVGSTPTHFMASEYPGFEGALWRPYSRNPSFALRANHWTGPGGTTGTVYFRVKDGSGRESMVARGSI